MEMNSPRRGSMFYGAVGLALGSIALRFVQLIFQVYISDLMGPAGLGRMQLILTVGSFAGIFASGGVRIAVTCLAAEETGNPAGVRSAVGCCAIYGLLLSSVTAAALYLLAGPLADGLLRDQGCVLSLRILAVFLPVNCLWAVLAGYYTAAGRITELVLLEFAERLGSVGLVVLLIRLQWIDPCAAVFLGSSIASTLSLIWLLCRYFRQISSVPRGALRPMARRLLGLTVPIGMNDVLRSGLSMLEHMLIPKGLERSGRSSEAAIAAYGTIGGMVFPVITFPCIILHAVSDLLVPELARSRALERAERIRFLTEKCLRLTVLFSVATAGLCYLLGNDLGELLFHSEQAGAYIRIFAPLIPILYVDAITDGMLKGLSQQLHTVRYNTFTSLVDLALILLLLPRYGIGGFLAAFTISHAINFMLSIRRLLLVTGYLPCFRATILSGVCCFLSLMALLRLPETNVFFRGGLFLGGYTLLVRLTGALSGEDAAWLRSLVHRTETAP